MKFDVICKYEKGERDYIVLYDELFDKAYILCEAKRELRTLKDCDLFNIIVMLYNAEVTYFNMAFGSDTFSY